MKTISKDQWLAIALFGLLVLISVASAFQKAGQQEAPTLASFSSEPDGARALRLWLEELGYETLEGRQDLTQMPTEASIAWLLGPQIPPDEAEWLALDRWVEAGGLLVLAGDGDAMDSITSHFDFQFERLAEAVEELNLHTPLLASQSLTGTVTARAEAYLNSERTDYVTHLGVEAGPVLVSFNQGEGLVVLSAATNPFTNAGLKEPGNPALILSLIAQAEGRGSRLAWFDEWSHGLQDSTEAVTGPDQWLFRTRAGQSLLFIFVVIFLALVLEGQAFGRPLRSVQTTTRRAPLEYITALANLSRRAGHRADVLNQYHRRLKSQLGQRYRLDPDLADDEWVAQMAQYRPELEAEALLALLKALRKTNASEAEMLRLARQAATWMKPNA